MDIDDDIITGSTTAEHDEALLFMLEASRKNNIGLNSEKLQFKASSVNFSDRTITSQDLKLATEKLDAIRNLPTAKNSLPWHDHLPQPLLRSNC